MSQPTAPMRLCHLLEAEPSRNSQGGVLERVRSRLAVSWVEPVKSLLVDH